MKIIGCDFHPGYQQIAVLESVTGEMVEKALSHERKEEVRAVDSPRELNEPVTIRRYVSRQRGRMLSLGNPPQIRDRLPVRRNNEQDAATPQSWVSVH